MCRAPFWGSPAPPSAEIWTERCDAGRATIALAIAQTHGLPDMLARVLAGRGVGVHDAEEF